MGVALDGACKLGWYKKMGFVVYRRLKTNDLSEAGGKVSPPCDIKKTISGPELFALPSDKKNPIR